MKINAISNNYNARPINFKNDNNDTQKVNLARMLYRNRAKLVKHVEQDVPDTFTKNYSPKIYKYDIPNTKNQALIAICAEPNSISKHKLIAGAYSKQQDTLCTKFILQDAYKQKIKDYFKTPNGIKNLASTIIQCSDEINKDSK